jgi:hypothetical protein
VVVPREVEGKNHPCSYTGGMPGLAMADGGSMCYQSDMPGKTEQGCAAAAAAGESGPTSIVLVGEDSLGCYQTGRMTRYSADVLDIAAAEGSTMSA